MVKDSLISCVSLQLQKVTTLKMSIPLPSLYSTSVNLLLKCGCEHLQTGAVCVYEYEADICKGRRLKK